ncbi:Disease resistance protein (CC-NBS-LRR class) family [Rhynchospora pubera]|uniref:Disease resistance protein (CC-NBS-LRR class) family n=1 Tax=Rhynchospora pubera TaxID=906938 RepID=A0AAV8CHM1_9POAL|nr:Disease resistance protein (CC-NBS-LRR class) family [Rhynchospora pubera]
MWLDGAISNLLSLGAKLLPAVSQFSLSSTGESHQNQIETELKKLMKLLEWIKARLYDAEEREIRDRSVKLWLKELRGVAYDAEDVLDEYHYEVLRAQVEARRGIQVPDDMLDKIQQIRCKFDEITQDRIALQLSEEEAPRRYNSDLQIAPTSHCVVEFNIIGREREKEKLIDLVLSESHDGKTISVVTIVGTGGIGKTTLAQLVYNDQKIRQTFDKFGWVCVSEDFNVQRLIREVVESITGKPCDLTNLSVIQDYISKDIKGKSVFLVLDDVWNESRHLWESFWKSFMSVSLLKILVTTRNETVARIMQTLPTFKINYMSNKQSWRLFQRYAFGEVVPNRGSKLVEIGKLILKKCGNLPLAIKSIASLLRHEPEEESWREILDSELWELDVRNEIFEPLQISYARLPTYLKPCFLYCSMFPKDHLYDAEELVQLWISQGYVQNNGLKNKKKVGWEYIKQLWQRSFFQGEYREKEFKFTLHDIIHDLAQSISGHGCYSIGEDMVSSFSEEPYHLYIVGRSKELIETDRTPFRKFTTLRTLHFVEQYFFGFSTTGFNFSETKSLRALKLEWGDYLEYASFVNLKHLRYMCLNSLPQRLPECICSLYNLQYLTLDSCRVGVMLENIQNLVSLEELTISYCYDLRVLPTSVCQLKALQKLFIRNCPVMELPRDIGNLTKLQHLTFVDTKVRSLPPSLNKIIKNIKALNVNLECSTIGWLDHLVDLGGTLNISIKGGCNLENVRCANIESMHKLHCLMLGWNLNFSVMDELEDGCVFIDYNGNGIDSGDEVISEIDSRDEVISKIDSDDEVISKIGSDDESLICCLKPHPNLKKLEIHDYRSRTFPCWIENPTLLLESIVLKYCQATFLPFGGLHKLKHLKLEFCYLLQIIQEDSLPLMLEEIKISKCHNLISVTGIQRLKSLVKLDINNCSKLCWLDHCWDSKTCTITVTRCPKLRKWRLQQHLSCKEVELWIWGYGGRTFPDWVGNPISCASLEKIELEQCTFITFLPFGGLQKLKQLIIFFCLNLQIIQEESLPLGLEEIEISYCDNLISIGCVWIGAGRREEVGRSIGKCVTL